MNRPFYLYHTSNDRHARGVPVVELVLVSASVQHQDGVELRFDTSPYDRQPFTIVWLEGRVSNRNTARRSYGLVEIPARERPPDGSRSSVTWLWRLLPEDLESIRADRVPNDGPTLLHLELAGIAIINGVPSYVVGDQQIEIDAAAWTRIESDLKYAIPPSQERQLSPVHRQSPSWRYAVDQLRGARRRLDAGEGHDAMQDVLGEFESLHTAPYTAEAWGDLLSSVPPQKARGVSHMLAGFCLFLNVVGHHREQDARDEADRLPPMPLDQWEAELAVAVGHYLLAYARRLATGATAVG